jgi:hypothetical protein
LRRPSGRDRIISARPTKPSIPKGGSEHEEFMKIAAAFAISLCGQGAFRMETLCASGGERAPTEVRMA